MQEERLKLLLDFLETEPDEPFNRYAVAMELMKTDNQAALEHLEILRNQHPDYLATYYQLAQLYVDLDAFSEAEKMYEQGISLAKKLGNGKTESELLGAYRMLKDEMEEW